MAETVKIELLLDAEGAVVGARTADGELVKLEKTTEKLDARVDKLGKTFTRSLKVAAAAAVVALTLAMKEGVALALRQEQQMNILAASVRAANREFGASVGTIDSWSATVDAVSKKFGLLQADVAEASARVLTMTKRLGLNEAQMQELIERAAVLSIGKTTLTGAIERITAALRGEAESAEFLGLTLNENTIKAKALEMGLNPGLWSALTEVEKAQIRWLVLLEQTDAQMQETTTLMDGHAESIRRGMVAWQQFWAEVGSGAFIAIDLLQQFLKASGRVLSQIYGRQWSDPGAPGPDPNQFGGPMAAHSQELQKRLTVMEKWKALLDQINAANRSGASGTGKKKKTGSAAAGGPGFIHGGIEEALSFEGSDFGFGMDRQFAMLQAMTAGTITAQVVANADKQREAYERLRQSLIDAKNANEAMIASNAQSIQAWAQSTSSIEQITPRLIDMLTQQITAYASLAVARYMATLGITGLPGLLLGGGIGILLGGVLGSLLGPLKGSSGGFSSSGYGSSGGGFTTSVGRAPSGGRSNLTASGGSGGLVLGELHLRGDTAVSQVKLRMGLDASAGVT